ncbi:hypothetical protein ACNOYE_25525 [Nannocystaceae bacterium ST9]
MTTRRTIILVTLASLAGCQQRLAEGEPSTSRTICTYVTMARVYDEQGTPVRMVLDVDGSNSEICLCLTPDELKSGDFDDWFNDRAFEACLEDAAELGYAEANDCDYWYEQGQWIKNIRVHVDAHDSHCDTDGVSEPLSCSVR